jgi:Spy/CpxP family protein refolding chaperone
MKRSLAIRCAVLCCAVAAVCSAGPVDGMPDGKWWKYPRVVRELQLTESQVDQIEKIFLRMRPQLIDLRADLEKKRLMQESAMEQPNVKTEEATRLIDETQEARSRLEKARARMFLEIRQVLTVEQREKILERRGEIRERRQERLRRSRPSPPPE